MLKVSTSPNPFPNSVMLNGAMFPTGAKLYIYLETSGTVVTPFTFMPSGQKESGAPYEYKGGQPVTFPDGAQTVTVKDGAGVTVDAATFTIGTGTPPPDPTKETVKVTANLNKVEIIVENDPSL